MKGVRIIANGPLARDVKVYDADDNDISKQVRSIRISMEPNRLIGVEMELLAERVEMADVEAECSHRCPYCGQETAVSSAGADE